MPGRLKQFAAARLRRMHDRILRTNYWRKELARQLASLLGPGEHLPGRTLEIGPGPGLSSSLLLHCTEELYAVDVNLDRLRELRRQSIFAPNRLVAGDATHLPLRDTSFNQIAVFTVLHHLFPHQRQEAFFAEAWRVLKPGGTIIGTDRGPDCIMRALHWGTSISTLEPTEVAAMLARGGFLQVQIVCLGAAYAFRARKGGL